MGVKVKATNESELMTALLECIITLGGGLSKSGCVEASRLDYPRLAILHAMTFIAIIVSHMLT